MSKAFRTIVQIGAVVAGIALAIPSGGTSLLAAKLGISSLAASAIAVGLSVGAALLSRPAGLSGNRSAVAAQLQLGEQPRQAIFGRAAVGGTLVDAFNYGGKYGTDWEVMVIALADHRCDALEGFYVDDTFVAYTGDGDVPGFNSQLRVFWRAGTWGQEVPWILTNHGPGWTADDRAWGTAYAVIAYKADDEKAKNPIWTGGRPRFRWVVRGLRCYDPRKDSTAGGSGSHRWTNPETWEWTENPIVIRYNWVRGIYAGDQVNDPAMLLIGRGLSELEAPPQNVFARANLCDELVDGQPRYRIGGLVAANEPFIAVESDFAAAVGGIISQPEGAVEVDPGQAKAPIAHFTDDDIIVGSTVSWNRAILGQQDDGWVNTVAVRFTDPEQRWNVRSAPVRRENADIIADRGPREQQPQLDFVNNLPQAQRLAEIVRRFGRLWGRAEVTLPPRFAFIEEGDWVTWQSNRRFGGATRTFRVEAWGSDRAWHHKLTLRQISASVYSDTAPLSDGVVASSQTAPPTVGTPGASAWVLTAAQITAGGVRVPALSVTGQSDDPAAQAVVIEYVQQTAVPDVNTQWRFAANARVDLSRIEVPVPGGGSYWVAVSYVVQGVLGDRRVLGPVTLPDFAYPDGVSIAGLKPAEAGANVTETRVAAAIASQGALATQNNVNLGTQVTGLLGVSNADNGLRNNAITIDTSGVLLGAGTAGITVDNTRVVTSGLLSARPASGTFVGQTYSATEVGRLFRWNGSSWAVASDITSSHTAAAITGQGALATQNNANWSQVISRPAALQDSSFNGSGLLNANMAAYLTGVTIDSLRPQEAGANVTETRVASAITGQGSLATRNNVTGAHMATSFGANLLPSTNPSWAPPETFFVAGWNPDGVTGINAYASAQKGNFGWEWSLDPGQTTWAIYQDNAGRGSNVSGISDYYFRWLNDSTNTGNYGQTIPVVPGQRVEFSIYMGNHRGSSCSAGLAFYDSSGNYLSEGDDVEANTATRFEGRGGNTLSQYKRVFRRATAPSGAVSCLPFIRKGHTETGSDSWLFLTSPMLCVVPSGQTELTPWAPPGDYGYSLYNNGVTINQLRPEEFGSNRTETRVASAITGQGALATQNNANWSQVISRPAALQDSSFNISGLLNANMAAYLTGVTIDSLRPQEAGANVTESRVASAINGQGPWATSAIPTSKLALIRPNLFPYPFAPTDGRSPAQIGWANVSGGGGNMAVADWLVDGAAYVFQRLSGGAETVVFPLYDIAYIAGQLTSASLTGYGAGGATFSPYIEFLNAAKTQVIASHTMVYNGTTDRWEVNGVTSPAGTAFLRIVCRGFFAASGSYQDIVWWAIKVERNIHATAFMEASFTRTLGNQVEYNNGTQINALRPAEFGSNVTENRTAAAIAGQGDLATRNANTLPFGTNEAVNSDFTTSLAGWRSNAPTISRNLGGWFGRRNVAYMHWGVASMGSNGWFDFAPDAIWNGASLDNASRYAMPVSPGERVYARALLGPHRCTGEVWVLGFNRTGGLVHATKTIGGLEGGGSNGENFGSPVEHITTIGASDVAWAMIMIRMQGNGGGNPYLFIAEPAFGKLPANQGVVPPYTPGRADRSADRTLDQPVVSQLNPANGRTNSRRALSQIMASGVLQMLDTNPITAITDGSNVSTITINAHTVYDDAGTISFSSGSIGGLVGSTMYYIYEFNPDFVGGARSYVATTSRLEVTGAGRRFVGLVTTPAPDAPAAGGGGGGGGGWPGGGEIP